MNGARWRVTTFLVATGCGTAAAGPVEPAAPIRASCAAENALRERALVLHRTAQRTRRSDADQAYDEARRAYVAYLECKPTGAKAYDMTFYYAELLFKLEHWEFAGDQYTRVVEMSPSGRYARESAYGAVIAWKNAVGSDPPFAPRVDKGSSPPPLPLRVKKLIAAFDNHLRQVPDAPEMVNIKYRRVRAYYDHANLEQAAKLSLEIVESHPHHDLAIAAAHIHLTAMNVLGHRKALCDAVDRFLEGPLVRDAGLAERLGHLQRDCRGQAAENNRRI